MFRFPHKAHMTVLATF